MYKNNPELVKAHAAAVIRIGELEKAIEDASAIVSENIKLIESNGAIIPRMREYAVLGRVFTLLENSKH